MGEAPLLMFVIVEGRKLHPVHCYSPGWWGWLLGLWNPPLNRAAPRNMWFSWLEHIDPNYTRDCLPEFST